MTHMLYLKRFTPKVQEMSLLEKTVCSLLDKAPCKALSIPAITQALVSNQVDSMSNPLNKITAVNLVESITLLMCTHTGKEIS